MHLSSDRVREYDAMLKVTRATVVTSHWHRVPSMPRRSCRAFRRVSFAQGALARCSACVSVSNPECCRSTEHPDHQALHTRYARSLYTSRSRGTCRFRACIHTNIYTRHVCHICFVNAWPFVPDKVWYTDTEEDTKYETSLTDETQTRRNA